MKWFLALPKKQAAVLALIIANIIWGAASPIFKWSLQNLPLFSFAYLRFFIPALILTPFALKRKCFAPRSDWLTILFLGLSGVTINITFFFLGLKNAPSINAPIIASAGPIFLALASLLFLHERLNLKKISGMLISLLGVLIIVGSPFLEKNIDHLTEQQSLSSMLGNLYFVIATLAAVVHTILNKKVADKYSPLVITWWMFTIGAVSFFPMFINEALMGSLNHLNFQGIFGLLYGSLLSSLVGYSLYAWSMSRIDACEIGLFAYIDPVIAAMIAIPLLGETITPMFILGSFFVFGGIFCAEGRIHYHPFHKLRPLR